MMTCDSGSLSLNPSLSNLYTNSLSKHTHTMFAVTTTTNVASTAKQCFSGKKTTSSRKSVSSIVKASASFSEEKFDRREMLKNALVASVATVVATPKPVSANVPS